MKVTENGTYRCDVCGKDTGIKESTGFRVNNDWAVCKDCEDTTDAIQLGWISKDTETHE